MESFTAIDFETAQGYRWSICQVGLVRVENTKIVEELSILVQPPNNYYWKKLIDIHGITPQKTKHEPTFDKIWHIVTPFIENQHVVAHNGFGFDFPCLRQTLHYYDLPIPEFTAFCTYRLYWNNLAALCRIYDIPLCHHDALSDARACAQLFLNYLNKN